MVIHRGDMLAYRKMRPAPVASFCPTIKLFW